MTKIDFLAWFAQWKDVVTAVVAVGAIIVVVAQIRQTGRFERDRIRREQVTARAILPLTLAALSDYGSRMLEALARLEQWLETKQMGKVPLFEAPRLPPETIAAVEKVIAAYPNEGVAKALAAILGEVQVLQSRSRDFSNREDSIRIWSIAMKDNVVLAASIIARCENLFDFARKGSEFAEPSRRHLQQILSLASMPEHQYPRVWKSVERYASQEPEIPEVGVAPSPSFFRNWKSLSRLPVRSRPRFP